MKYDLTLVGPMGFKHQFRLPYMGMLEVLAHKNKLTDILGPKLGHFSPKVVSVTPQLALPYYPSQ